LRATQKVRRDDLLKGQSFRCRECFLKQRRKRFAPRTKINRWTVIEDLGQRGYHVRCECGNPGTVSGYALLRGISKGCSECYEARKGTHRETGTKLYAIWRSMKDRCLNRRCHAFPNYGERGINIHPGWLTYQGFKASILATIGPRPEGCELDHTNNDGNYEPGNVRWASRLENLNNRRTSVMLTYNGVTQSLAFWAGHFGILYPTALQRYRRNWTFEKTFGIIEGK
jgi:hypothetical protein